MEKTTISARVPVEFKNDFNNWCKANNTTISEHIQRVFENVNAKTYIPEVSSVNVDSKTRGILVSISGGSAIAILTYQGIVAILTDKYPMKDVNEIKALAIAGATTVGLLSGLGINKLLNR